MAGCSTYKHTYVSQDEQQPAVAKLPTVDPVETLYLLGDAGARENLEKPSNPLFEHIQRELAKAGKNSSIVFLGDNLYPAGLPKTSKKDDRAEGQAVLDGQLDLMKDHAGRGYFIPGNHDWKKGKSGGLKATQRQERYIQKHYEDERVKFYPNHGCGDPVVKKVNKDLYYLFIDSQWWIQDWEKAKNINKGCEVKSRQQLLQAIEEIFLKHKNDQLVVFMHHPLFSNGEHGGKYALKPHLFPLTIVNDNLWVPLPILGSLMPLERSLGGQRQDIPHPLYQELKDGILDILSANSNVIFKNVIFAAGHEHSLQYFLHKSNHFIVSGSGSKVTYARQGGDAGVVRSALGYSKLRFYGDGEVWMDLVKVDGDSPDGELLFRKRLVGPRPGTIPTPNNYPKGSELEPTKLFAANPAFEAHGLKNSILGKQYREMWITPVKAPVVNLDTELGGLTPIKKGGGLASNSLRLEAPNGYQYAMRSIVKDYRKLVGPELADIAAIDLISDLNSASHPYGALVLPKLSKAANIYYTIPKLVYLKRQQKLGYFNDLFNEELYLLEDRPAGNRSESDHFGNTTSIISYLDLLERQRNDNHIVIDQPWTLRSRLFDVWIHDWDRHDDQWRWAKFEVDGKEVYRPIPRDRDQAFYKFDGFVPWLVGAFGVRKFKNFKDELIDVKWQSFNARYFDRYFLNALEWADWEKEIAFLQKELTDEIIAQGAQGLPAEVYADSHEELESKLRARRDELHTIGRKLYTYLAEVVSVTGSNKAELFEVDRQENGDVNVQVFDLSKKGKKKEKLFERTFKKGETKEIHLYGLDGKDQFDFKGKVQRSITIRVIGGFGKDKLKDDSHVAGLRKRTIVYDESDGIKIEGSGETKDLSGPALEENDYDRRGHLYNTTNFAPVLGFSQDDRLLIGLHVINKRHGFRHSPYAVKHDYKFSTSPSNRFFLNASYDVDLPKRVFRQIDLGFGGLMENPGFVNFFGLGNNTVETEDRLEFNWVRVEQYQAKATLGKTWLKQKIRVYAGPTASSWAVSDDAGDVASDSLIGFTDEERERRNYLGGSAGFLLNLSDSELFPREGIALKGTAQHLQELSRSESVTLYGAEVKAYVTFGNRFATTLAVRAGWNKADGDVQFYQTPSLGNNNFLRGFRNDRFRGDRAVYYNGDVRLRLGRWKNRIAPMDIGLVGGVDVGRVWLDGVSEGGFHTSVTAGIWMNALSAILLHPYVSVSDERTQVNFRLGFLF